jgi:hypothetical protein
MNIVHIEHRVTCMISIWNILNRFGVRKELLFHNMMLFIILNDNEISLFVLLH